ncbi:MAG: DUF58 domain-containing protein [Oscillospiraceae bacterium]|nr:DUF58 domain-containing protein [Oscillospiraceae bacterium]
MPTISFLFYLLILGVVWLFRMAYVGWLGPYLFACLLWVPLATLLLSLPSMLRMRLQLEAPETLTRNEEGHITIRFENRSLLPLRRVSVWLEVENRFTGEIKKNCFHYMGLVTSRGEMPLPTDFCGQLHCRLVRVECRDLLGLIALRRKCPPMLITTVLPQCVPPAVAPDLDTVLDAAVQLKPKYGGGYSEEHDLREYRPGDTVNSIHWKLSSKTDEVIVREPLISANQDIYLILGRIGKEDRGLELLYWLSLELCARELPHTFVADSLYDVGNEAEGVEALCTILAKPMDKPCPFDPAGARCVFLITDGEVAVK